MYNSHKKKVELKNQLTVHSSTTHKGTKVQHQIPPNENQCHKNSDSVLAVWKIKHKKGKKLQKVQFIYFDQMVPLMLILDIKILCLF